MLNDTINIILDFIKLFALLAIVIHWVGCFFFAVCSLEQSAGMYTFIDQAGITNADVGVQYVTSVYFVLQTMATIGYGEIHPVTTYEMIYVILAQVGACGFFSYILGILGSMLDKNETIIADFK